MALAEPPAFIWETQIYMLPIFPPGHEPPSSLKHQLSPLLRQKLLLLAFGRAENWPSLLTWLPRQQGDVINERLKNAASQNAGLAPDFKGYRRFDQETVQNITYVCRI
jgi:hypothetical protein